ncbi:alkylhydroperoxidase AhpD family core domain-containing protein [Pseudarcicella hirudinis]|uniref:Alkylhydroperoxidase AhpD family core domain-containing protein n=1 Tax=Pseudarcicella hirudinis TaxID=1079859 RepID=A0A1I5LX31_9BACT|nr:peroxidase [Pseudarcicella hirudinis]SFP01889.1 alkylhydroperoxidase AhpD family core domain-containing protein [Pseudarcicella hirudinis]
MQRISAIAPENATGKNQELFTKVKAKFGGVPNIMRTMAASPAVLDAYLSFNGALSSGSIGGKLGEKLALFIAEKNNCDYCLAAHSTIGKNVVKLDEATILGARQGHTNDDKTNAALHFAGQLIDKKGLVNDEDVQSVIAAGYTEGEVAEIVAHVSLNIFTNYFNNTAKTVVDFPVAPVLSEVAGN